MERLIIHIDMDAYFASVEQADNPFLKGKPVIVCGNPESRTVVAACSYEAKRYGIKSGMSLPEALSLCPQATVVPCNYGRYEEISERIFRSIRTVTENIEICSIDEAFADVSDIVNLYKGGHNICREIKAKVKKETSLPCSCGAGPNKLIAKITSSFAKPDGIRIIEQNEVDKFMENLPVEEVPGIGPKLSTRLHDMGITVCGNIRNTGKNFFTVRFGVVGEKIYYSACGIDESPVLTESSAAKSIGHSYTLPADTLDKEMINSNLFRLCDQVAKRMRDENRHGNYCTVSLRFADFSETTRRKKFNDIPPDGKKIYCLAIEILGDMKMAKPVRMLGVSIGGLFRADYNYLFPEKRETAFRAADVINERFGEYTVFPANLLSKKRKK